MPTFPGPFPAVPDDMGESTAMVDQLVLASKAKARRRWMIRSGLMLTVTAVIGFAVVVMDRNNRTRQSFLDQIKVPAAALESSLAMLGDLPAVIPQHAHVDILRYDAPDSLRAYATSTTEPTIIGYTAPITLIIQPAGRAVLLYHAGKIERRWMNERDFRLAIIAQHERLEAYDSERSARPPNLPD